MCSLVKATSSRCRDLKERTHLPRWVRLSAVHSLCKQLNNAASSNLIALISALAVVAVCHPHFQGKIPNGDIVPHPCKANRQWGGVGHERDYGGGARNQFGIDFLNSNKDWSLLCPLDSDGDTRTNGQELGDPNCDWTEESVPFSSSELSHPGVCEPMNSTICAGVNDWVECTDEVMECPAMDEPQTQNLTFNFPRTDVPGVETTLTCMRFNLPVDTDYHIVATTPYIDNVNVVHHIVITGCMDYAPVNASPGTCGSIIRECSITIGIWDLGMPGQCMPNDLGIPFGLNSDMKSVLIQLHWNNPALRSDHHDGSGMTLYYTPLLRRYIAYQLYMGQLRVEIPPKVVDFDVRTSCTSRCTRHLFSYPIYIVEVQNHMHHMGRAAVTELIREGENMQEIGREIYDYGHQKVIRYSTPIEMRPGDELVFTCTFTSNKDSFAYYGDATSDEMCLTSYTYFTDDPDAHLAGSTMCYQRGNADICDILYKHKPEGCSLLEFQNMSNPDTVAMIDKVMESCRFPTECNPDCADAVDDGLDHACMKGNALPFMKSFLSRSLEGEKVLSSISACANQKAKADYKSALDMLNGIDEASSIVVSHLFVLTAVVFAWVNY